MKFTVLFTVQFTVLFTVQFTVLFTVLLFLCCVLYLTDLIIKHDH